MVKILLEILIVAAIVLVQLALSVVKYGAGVAVLIWLSWQVPAEASWLGYGFIALAGIGFGGLVLTDKAINNIADDLLTKAINKGVI
jgi:hypothetical protein